ncbi:sigma-70 family RNA polymerase sigma factor [Nocardia brasiliensis]
MLTQLADLDPGSHEHPRLDEQIQRRCLPLADHIARRYTGWGENDADLYQVACVGLVAAIDRFDPTRRTPFTAFAIPTIMGEARRYFPDYGWAVRVRRRTKEIQLTLALAIDKLCQARHVNEEQIRLR